MTDNILNREILATEYVKQSGKAIHSSDCATSRAPAEVPVPCDCDEPQRISDNVATPATVTPGVGVSEETDTV